MRNILLIVFLLVVINGCAQTTKKTGQNKIETLVNEEKTKLKNSAFCSCLNKVYPGYDDKLNDGSAAGYFETSAYNVEAFEKVDSLAGTFASKNFKSKYNRNLGIQKCLEFYNSKELEMLTSSLEGDLDRSKLKDR